MQPTWTSDCGRVVLYCADCLDVLPTLAAGSVDAVVTDPPYGISYSGKGIANSCEARNFGMILGDDRPFAPPA